VQCKMFLFIEEENLRGNKKAIGQLHKLQNIFVKSLHTLSSAFFCFQHLSNYLRRWICMDVVTNHLHILQIPVLELLRLVGGRQSRYENARLLMIWNSICGYLILALHLVVQYNTSVYFKRRLAMNSLFTHL
jgi:uncharacterized membrane protein